jgi:cytochrome c556
MQAGEFIGKCVEMILFGGLAAATTTRGIIVNIRTRFRAVGILIFSAIAITATAAEPTLREIMQDLRDNLVEITDGLLTDDFDRVAQGATGIAQHAPISAPQAKRIANELGPEMPAFKQFDQQVHTLSVSIATASKAKDREAVISHYQRLVDGCLGCHAAFKARVSKVLGTAP